MPTTTATEDPKPNHGLLDWNFLTLMALRARHE